MSFNLAIILALLLPLVARAQEISFPIGVTRANHPILATITADDLDIHVQKRRILLVAGLDGSPSTSQAAKAWMSANTRDNVAFSAIVCGNPDALQMHRVGKNSVGGDPARGYPPKGEAYNSPTDPESQTIWRWIGMHAPDLVIELIDGPETKAIDLTDRPTDSLAVQLPQHAVGGVGTVRAAVWSLSKDAQIPNELLNGELARLDAKPPENSARYAMQQRDLRQPLQVCEQLAKVYGHDLPTVAYIPAVACMGRLRLAKLTGDASALPDLLQITKEYYSGKKPTLTEKSSGSDFAGHILWGELYDATGDKRYIDLAKAAADRAFDSEGKPLEAMPSHLEMSDSVFMGCPILAQVGRLTGEAKYFDMCLKHMRFMLRLNLRSDGLHRHSPLDETAWGRGNGFPALGLALALDDMPKEHAGRGEMLDAFQTHLATLLRHQDSSGAWHQVVDHPESYRELTSTCMITYAMIRGMRRGWLSREQYEPPVRRGWKAIKSRVAQDGQLVDVCTGTGKMKSLREYLDRTAILGRDPRGGAMALLVSTEMAAWEHELQK